MCVQRLLVFYVLCKKLQAFITYRYLSPNKMQDCMELNVYK